MEKNAYKYRLVAKGKIVLSGITYDLGIREAEHQKDYLGSRIIQVGVKTTWEEALKWERK